MTKKKATSKTVESLTHEEATRKNIPTAEYQSIMQKGEQNPVRVAYERRNRDLDPQLVWRGKDEQDWSDLVVHASPVYIQEKVHPKVLIDDLLKRTQADDKTDAEQIDLFSDFNGLPDDSARTEFYQHDANWTNRMILGDSLQVMASLAEREGLRGQVQCIYLDPPYGIKFNSNFQWSTTSRDVKDGNVGHITREPEQVKAFRDTWRDGIHSYLTYLRDRFTVARDLLTDSGTLFVQIGEENLHRVRCLLDEIFGSENFVIQIGYRNKNPLGQAGLASVFDTILQYAKNRQSLKFRPLFADRLLVDEPEVRYITSGGGSYQTVAKKDIPALPKSDHERIFRRSVLVSSGYTKSCTYRFQLEGKDYSPITGRSWRTHELGMTRLKKGNRVMVMGSNPQYRQFYADFPVMQLQNIWNDTAAGDLKIYVVQTLTKIVERCILMSTDPGDLVLDPTCGSGTTAFAAEQWGRRWITIDTSRVSLALARARIMGARYPYYLLADSPEGQKKEAEITRSAPATTPTHRSINHGFVYERVPHIMLRSIANNAEIDVIWDEYEEGLRVLLGQLNILLGLQWEEWEVPRDAEDGWSDEVTQVHMQWWDQRISRQKEIDASIAAKADFEYLYDKPYEDKGVVRVAGPFTVESLSPHRVLAVGADDELIVDVADAHGSYGEEVDFVQMILENLKTAGVQQAHKEDRITFTSLTPWAGDLICGGRSLR